MAFDTLGADSAHVTSAPGAALPHPDELPQIYAARGRGKCLEPLIEDGALLVFDKDAEVRAGDMVVIHRKPESARPGEFPSMIKRMVMGLPPLDVADDSELMPLVVVEQLNPPRQFTYEAKDVIAVHKCVGRADCTGDGWAAYDPAQTVEW